MGNESGNCGGYSIAPLLHIHLDENVASKYCQTDVI